MSETEDLLAKLKEPFDPRFVKWRVGATNEKKENGRVVQKATRGIALAYIDSREVMKRLDEVVGIDKWQAKYPHFTERAAVCEIGIKIGDEWVWKSNAAGDTQVEAEKGSASDAFKRAAVLWGIGRYLYYLPNKWYPLDDYKKLAETPQLPSWALPKGK